MAAAAHEIKIISLIKSGDKRGIPLLYKYYNNAIYGIIIRLVNNEEVAKEVMQDVFVKAWKYASKYDPNKGRLYTWLAQIARNSSLTTIKSGNFQRSTKTDSLSSLVYSSESLSMEDKINDAGLAAVINQLDDKHKILIDYIYYRGYSQRDAAEALSIPVGTVKTRIRAAIIELRKILGNDIAVMSVLFALLFKN